MNSVRHKWLAIITKTHFASREAHQLGAIFWACELCLSLFWFLTNSLEMLLVSFYSLYLFYNSIALLFSLELATSPPINNRKNS